MRSTMEMPGLVSLVKPVSSRGPCAGAPAVAGEAVCARALLVGGALWRVTAVDGRGTLPQAWTRAARALWLRLAPISAPLLAPAAQSDPPHAESFHASARARAARRQVTHRRDMRLQRSIAAAPQRGRGAPGARLGVAREPRVLHVPVVQAPDVGLDHAHARLRRRDRLREAARGARRGVTRAPRLPGPQAMRHIASPPWSTAPP